MTEYVRGSMVFFSATFVDKDGAPATPDSATLRLVYRTAEHSPQTSTVSMTVAGNVATASWDSSDAMPGIVKWSAKGTGLNAIVQDGSFTLTANEANA